MLTTEIPQRLDVRCSPFTGIYDKRQMADKTLFCWFINGEDEKLFPHVSVHITLQHNVWKYFHVTFPIQIKSGWDTDATNMSFSISYEIAGAMIKQVGVTDTNHIKRVDGGGMTYVQMKKESVAFASAFVKTATDKAFTK